MDAELEAFREALRGPEPAIDLGRAALLIARLEHPGLEPEPSLRLLDDLAKRSRAARCANPAAVLARLREFLFSEEGFRGNAGDYFDPLNSCLNDVLARRLGIPITLSVLTMEVGRRVGVEIEGVGLPGHFVVRARTAGATVLIDPFHGGRELTQDGAADVVAEAFGRSVTLTGTHFAPVRKTQVVARMLANLKAIYVQREEWAKALAAIDRLLVVDGGSPAHVRDRGTVLMKLGDFHLGAAEWDRYLTRYPHAKDAEKLRGQLRQIRQALASLN